MFSWYVRKINKTYLIVSLMFSDCLVVAMMMTTMMKSCWWNGINHKLFVAFCGINQSCNTFVSWKTVFYHLVFIWKEFF